MPGRRNHYQLNSSLPLWETTIIMDKNVNPPGQATNEDNQLRQRRSRTSQLGLKSDSFIALHNDAEKNQVEKPISRGITVSFKVLRFFMLGLLKFPFLLIESSNGSFKYTFTFKSGRGIGFLVMNVFLTIVLVLNLITYFGLVLDYPTQEYPFAYNTNNTSYWRNLHDEEVYLMHRNNSHIIAIFCHLTHVVVSSWALIVKRDTTAQYLSFWSSVDDVVVIDVAKGTKKYMNRATWSYIAVYVVIAILNFSQIIPAYNGASAIFTILTLRTFSPDLHTWDSFGILRNIFGVILMYIRICSSVFILLYLFQCLLLINAFREWNRRLRFGLFRRHAITRFSVFVDMTASSTPKKGADAEQNELVNPFRTSLELLYKDYHYIARIMEGTDQVFSVILLTYYGSQILGTCFEMFHFYNALLNKDEFSETRRLDALAMLLYVTQSLVLVFTVSRVSARAGSEAIEGLEVLRAKGYLGKKTPEEAYFMLSMAESYGGYFETVLTGGKFFVIDLTFVVTVGATIFTYAILIIQFTYIFKTNFEDDMRALKKPSNSTLILQDLLQHVEGTINVFGLGTDF